MSECVMGGCPIPWECERVGACYEAQRADERARYEADERAYYAEQEAEYHAAMRGEAVSRIKTDYDEVVTVEAEEGGDVVLGIVHGIGSTEATLRPSQAERLAAELLAYANGDHRLPPDAVRPRRIIEGSATPPSSGSAEPDDAYAEYRHRTDPPPFGRGLPE